MNFSELLSPKTLALLFFLVFWLVVLGRLLIAKGDFYDSVAEIPLHDDRVITPRVDGSVNAGSRRGGDDV